MKPIVKSLKNKPASANKKSLYLGLFADVFGKFSKRFNYKANAVYFCIACLLSISLTACAENLNETNPPGAIITEAESADTVTSQAAEIPADDYADTTPSSSAEPQTSPDEPGEISPAHPEETEQNHSAGDYPAITLEAYEVSGTTLILTLVNRTGDDLGYIHLFTLSQNGATITPQPGYGICGTPDRFPADGEIKLHFDLGLMYGNTLSGAYSLEMEFKNYEHYFDTNEIITQKWELELDTLSAPGEFSVDYTLEYMDNGDVLIKYHNNSSYEVAFGRYYKLLDENRNEVPFMEGAAFMEDAMLMMPGGDHSLTVYLTEPYFDALESGNYIVVHELYGQKTEVMEISITIG